MKSCGVVSIRHTVTGPRFSSLGTILNELMLPHLSLRLWWRAAMHDHHLLLSYRIWRPCIGQVLYSDDDFSKVASPGPSLYAENWPNDTSCRGAQSGLLLFSRSEYLHSEDYSWHAVRSEHTFSGAAETSLGGMSEGETKLGMLEGHPNRSLCMNSNDRDAKSLASENCGIWV